MSSSTRFAPAGLPVRLVRGCDSNRTRLDSSCQLGSVLFRASAIAQRLRLTPASRASSRSALSRQVQSSRAACANNSRPRS